MKRLAAKTIYFRFATPEDAEFLYSLRKDEQYNQFLSKTSGGIEQQRDWLISYQQREKAGTEFYFIIKRNDNDEKIGCVRLYDFINGKESFCWGSWILNSNKTSSAAIESALLIYEFAFNELIFHSCHFDVRNENKKVIDFHLKTGAQLTSRDELDSFFTYTPENFNQFVKKYSKFLGKNND